MFWFLRVVRSPPDKIGWGSQLFQHNHKSSIPKSNEPMISSPELRKIQPFRNSIIHIENLALDSKHVSNNRDLRSEFSSFFYPHSILSEASEVVVRRILALGRRRRCDESFYWVRRGVQSTYFQTSWQARCSIADHLEKYLGRK